MGSSCVSRLCCDGSDHQQSGTRQVMKKVMKDAATDPLHPETLPVRSEDTLHQQTEDASRTSEEGNALQLEQQACRRSIVAPVTGMLFMVVPSNSPLHHDGERGHVLQADASESSFSKGTAQRSADKSSSAASMAALYGHHPLGPLKDAFDSTHASHRHSVDTMDNHPAATRSAYSLNSDDLLRSDSNEEGLICSRHRPWRSGPASGGGAMSPNSQRSSGDDEQRGSSSSAADPQILRLPRFLM